jgi:hypothetical protein
MGIETKTPSRSLNVASERVYGGRGLRAGSERIDTPHQSVRFQRSEALVVIDEFADSGDAGDRLGYGRGDPSSLNWGGSQ